MEIKRLGSYLEVNEHGYLEKLANMSHIRGPWHDAVEAIKQMYLDKWGEALHSIYIRGSVAKGCAQENVSDLDSFAVFPNKALKNITDSMWIDWTLDVQTKICTQFPFVADIEVYRVSQESVLYGYDPEAVTIKLESVCIYGDDLAAQIKEFKPNGEIAGQTRYYRKHLGIFCQEYPLASEQKKSDWLVWITRRSLRLGMQLVMEKENRYTNDLYLCYESFIKHHPEKQSEMYHMLELAINPVPNPESEGFIKDFGEWLAQKAHACLQAWGIEEIL